jgi:hypothetical protein
LTPAVIAPQVSKALPYMLAFGVGGKNSSNSGSCRTILQNCSSNFVSAKKNWFPRRSSLADPETTPNQPPTHPASKGEQIDCIETMVNNFLFPVFFYQVCGGFHFIFSP